MTYDLTLKFLFAGPPQRLIQDLLGAPLGVTELLTVEYPSVTVRRADLVARLTNNRLLHLELQSTSENIAWRELDYYSLISRTYNQPPIQIVVYVGSGKMRIPAGIDEEALQFHYRVVDVRDIDGEPLLDSDSMEDNLLAVLCRVSDSRATVRRVLRRIAALPPAKRRDTLAQLLILSGLRGLTQVVEEEVKEMPITLDIRENSFLWDLYQKGRKEGAQEGEAKGEAKGEQTLLRRQLERRFGPLPAWAVERIEGADTASLEAWSLRFLDASNLEDVLR